MTHTDRKGFVDLLVDTPVGGRVYMCVTCVEQAGRQAKMLSKGQAEDLTLRLAGAAAEITDLRDQLVAERENKVVSLADVRALVASSGAAVSAKRVKESLAAGGSNDEPEAA